MYMNSRAESDAYLLANPESVLAVVHFVRTAGSGSTDISFLLQTNTTTKFFKGYYQDPNFFIQARRTRALRYGCNVVAFVSPMAH